MKLPVGDAEFRAVMMQRPPMPERCGRCLYTPKAVIRCNGVAEYALTSVSEKVEYSCAKCVGDRVKTLSRRGPVTVERMKR